jgi:hypothetical protein
MARGKRKNMNDRDLGGFKYFKILAELTESLHAIYIDPDHPHKRRLHYDQYVSLILLYFFNPICDSLRMVQKATEFRKVQRTLDVPRFGRSTLAEASKVFDAELLKEIIGQLADRIPDKPLADLNRDELAQIVTLVDGSWMSGVADMLWAHFRSGNKNNAAKAHVWFELAKGVPVAGTITDANTSEFDQLQTTLEADRLYVLDRGYAKYALLQAILDAKSGFVVRLADNAVFAVEEERLLSDAALKAGVVRDAVVRLGYNQVNPKIRQAVRIVEVECTPHRKPSGKTGRGGPEQGETILLATDRLDLSPETISTIYQKRWAIEIFFRFFKHILGCRHLISHDENGLQLQLYVAIIACLLISIWTGLKPNKTVLKLMEFHLMGWADEDELMDQLARLKAQAEKVKK